MSCMPREHRPRPVLTGSDQLYLPPFCRRRHDRPSWKWHWWRSPRKVGRGCWQSPCKRYQPRSSNGLVWFRGNKTCREIIYCFPTNYSTESYISSLDRRGWCDMSSHTFILRISWDNTQTNISNIQGCPSKLSRQITYLISLSTKVSNNVNNIALGDVVLEIWGHLYWRPPSLKMAEINAGGAK